MNIMRYSAFKLVLATFTLTLAVHSEANGQLDIPLENRTLTGSAEFLEAGRHVGQKRLGTITLTSSSPADGEIDPPSHDIRIGADGYAFLSNGLVLRNASGSELVFNEAGQSHDLDVLFLGNGSYNVDNFSLSSSNEYTNGSDETVTAFGGHWHWQADYNKIDGSTATFAIDNPRFDNNDSRDGELPIRSGISPIDLSNKSGPETTPLFNRTTAARPRPLASVRDFDSPPFQLIEDQTPLIERRNVLLSVDTPVAEPPVADGDPPPQPSQPTLDLSGITLSAVGTSLRDRRLSFDHPDFILSSSVIPTISAGRVLKGNMGETIDLSRTDDVTVRTFGDDDQSTRIRLSGGADVISAGGRLTASYTGNTDFDSADDTKLVTFSADFANIDRSQLGTFYENINLGNRISSLENLDGENIQNDLAIRYSYGVVDNNNLRSDDVTYFTIDDADASGKQARNFSLTREFSTDTHTAITANSTFTLDGSANQSVTYSSANGNVFAEGLDGEAPTASTTFNAHRKNVQSTITTFTEGGQLQDGDKIEISNDRESSSGLLQAETFIQFERKGSTRWTLPELNGFDGSLAAGESISLTATFDDSNLSSSSLGRNYRTQLTAQFQDGVGNLFAELEPESELARVESALFNSDLQFSLIGSDATRQSVSYFVERNDEVTATSGSAMIAEGGSLFGEGINLTNTAENSSDGFQPTEFRVVDSEILNTGSLVEVSFSSLDNASAEEAEAFGFDVLVSDIAKLTGLDGVLHVVDLSIAPDSGGSEVYWLDEENGNWINAVLGNSNINAGIEVDPGSSNSGFISVGGDTVAIEDYLAANRFNGSYESYIESLEGAGPELGAFGSDGVRAWAVIDHNSSFALAAAAVPEPSAISLIGCFVIGAFARRRRTPCK